MIWSAFEHFRMSRMSFTHNFSLVWPDASEVPAPFSMFALNDQASSAWIHFLRDKVCSLKMTLLVERPQSTWFQTRNWRQKKKTEVQAYPSPRKKLVQFRVQKIVFFPWSHYCNKPIGATKMPSKGTTIRIVIDPFAIVHLGDVSKGWIKSRLILKTITQFQNRDRQFHCFSHLIQFQKIPRYLQTTLEQLEWFFYSEFSNWKICGVWTKVSWRLFTVSVKSSNTKQAIIGQRIYSHTSL